jgi:hypothetical protein
MAKIVEAPNKYSAEEESFWLGRNLISLFLAGGITDCPDWQQDLIEKIKDLPDLVVYNPRRKYFPMDDPNESRIQIEWEYEYLRDSDIIIFWFSRGSLNPIVLYELGRWGNSSDKKIIIGLDPQYERKQDVIIQTELSRSDVKFFSSIPEIAEEIFKILKDLNYTFKNE